MVVFGIRTWTKLMLLAFIGQVHWFAVEVPATDNGSNDFPSAEIPVPPPLRAS